MVRKLATGATKRGTGVRQQLTIGGIALLVAVMMVGMGWKLQRFAEEQRSPPELGVAMDPAAEAPPAAAQAPVVRLPAAADVAAAATSVAAGRPPPSWAEPLDAATIAWARAASASDAGSAPERRRPAAWELRAGAIARGAALRCVAHVEVGDTSPTDALRVRLADGSPALVAPIDFVPSSAGASLELEGRYLGTVPAPGGVVPVIACSAVRSVAPDVDDDWSGIDDRASGIEPLPFARLLREAAAAGAAADAGTGEHLDWPSLNQTAQGVIERPAEMRGRSFRVQGYVLATWRERCDLLPDMVVRRALLFRRDWTSAQPGGGTEKTVRLARLHLYDLALRGDGPLPERGQEVVAEGRFLKTLLHRSSTSADKGMLAPLLVASGLRPVRAQVQLPVWSIGVAVVVFAFGGVLVWHTVRETSEQRRLAQRLDEAQRWRDALRGPPPPAS